MKSEIQNIPPKSPDTRLSWPLHLVLGSFLLPFSLIFLAQNKTQATDSQYVIAQAPPPKTNQYTPDNPSATSVKPSFNAFETQRNNTTKMPQILLPEGYAINGRSAILLKHPRDYRWFLKFKPGIKTINPSDKGSSDSNQQPVGTEKPPKKQRNELLSKLDPFAVPFEVLPCQWLTKMRTVSGDLESGSINFRVWAEVTIYHKRNYILPSNIYLLSLFGKAATNPQSNPASGSSRLDSLNPISGLSNQSKNKDTRKPLYDEDLDQSKTIDNLRNMLLSLPRAQPLTLTDDDHKSVDQQRLTLSPIQKPLQKNNKTGTANKPFGGQIDSSRNRGSFSRGGKTRSDLKESAMIVDRVGRLVYDPDEQMWMFAFESDASHLTEAPIALLPCQLLEVMEKRTYQSTRRVKFRISGRVTKYQNRNYLLLRKLLLVFEQGNIGK